MGRYKELLEKEDKGKLSDEEKEELAGLKKDIEEATAPEEPAEEPENGDEEEKAIEELSNAVVGAVEKAVKPISDLAEKLSEKPVVTTKESKFIVDGLMGKTSVDKLAEEKIELPERKRAGKKFYEVSKLTSHWLSALLTGNKEKLQVLVEGTAGLGGNIVPQEFANIIVEDLRDQVIMRQFATVLQMSTDTLNLPTLDTRPHVAWRSEAAVKQTTTVQWGNLTLTPYSLAGIVGLSNELVADASQGVGASVVNYVANLLTRAIAEEEETAFWTGNGSGRPTGIDNYTFTSVDAGAGASDSARADAYKELYFRLGQPYRARAVWAANASTWARAATLKDSQNNYLLQRLADSPIPQIMGRPAYEVSALPDGKVFLGDFSYYYIGEREGIQVDTSTEATVASNSAFERNLTFVRVEERVDGELALNAAVVEGANMGGAF